MHCEQSPQQPCHSEYFAEGVEENLDAGNDVDAGLAGASDDYCP